MSEHVILLHGLWMRGIALYPLARRLRRAGYTVETLDYASVLGGTEAAIERLRGCLRAGPAATVHLVGHSLGGLVALEAVRDAAGLPAGCVVCLGSPLCGSAVARGLAGSAAGGWLLGQSAERLSRGVAAWSGARAVGVIAGCRPFGIGALVGTLAAPHDGTVAVAETRLPGVAGHRTIAATHTGLLFSAAAADLTIDFLRRGAFGPAPR